MKLLVASSWAHLLLLALSALVCQRATCATASTQASTTSVTRVEHEHEISKNQTSRGKQQQQQSQQKQLECEYDKGEWQECQANGEQIRTLRLKAANKALTNKAASEHRKCQPVKFMRRECKVGCKYARGEWSSSCGSDGLRVRIDTLVASNVNNKLAANSTCELKRKVTKDCKRACHYIKSPWSECINGWKTRNLTLDNQMLNEPRAASKAQLNRRSIVGSSETSISNAPATFACDPYKQVRRECGVKNSFIARTARKQQQQQQQQQQLQQNALSQPTTNNRTVSKPQTPAQRRRQKQLQRQQERENRLKASTISSSSTTASSQQPKSNG